MNEQCCVLDLMTVKSIFNYDIMPREHTLPLGYARPMGMGGKSITESFFTLIDRLIVWYTKLI